MYTVFINNPPISPQLATIPALLAKSSLVWPAVLNMILLKVEEKKSYDSVKDENISTIPLIHYTKIRKVPYFYNY